MGFVICGILVLWEKEGEEGRNRERRVGARALVHHLLKHWSFLLSPSSLSPSFESK